MMISGEITCENCQKEIIWYYQIANRLSADRNDVGVIPNDRVGLYRKPYKTGEDTYTLSCYCPHCSCLNSFDYYSEIEIN